MHFKLYSLERHSLHGDLIQVLPSKGTYINKLDKLLIYSVGSG